MNMSHNQAMFLGTIFLILVIVAGAIGLGIYVINRIFKKQAEILEQQESELVALRRASSAGTIGLSGPGTASADNILEEK